MAGPVMQKRILSGGALATSEDAADRRVSFIGPESDGETAGSLCPQVAVRSSMERNTLAIYLPVAGGHSG